MVAGKPMGRALQSVHDRCPHPHHHPPAAHPWPGAGGVLPSIHDRGRLSPGVRGWVRNRLDGTVEALASGPAEAVQALIAWAHDGPPAARVQRVQVEEMAIDEESAPGFHRRETV